MYTETMAIINLKIASVVSRDPSESRPFKIVLVTNIMIDETNLRDTD